MARYAALSVRGLIMTTWYEEKMNFHHKQWAVAQETGKQKAADFHMGEYLNYKEMAGMSSKG